MKRKISILAAIIAAMSIMLTSCGSPDSSEADTTSMNVIGGPDSNEAEGEGSSAEGTSAVTFETVAVTDENGETVTNAEGEAMTEPVLPEIDPSQTLNEQELLDAMTATAPPPQLNINQYSGKRYGYDTLTDEEKQLYDAIKVCAENLRYRVCPEDAFTMEEWAKVFGMVYNQEPQLFYLSSKMKVGKLFYITKDPDTINSMQASIDATADKLVNEGSGKSTFEKLKIFHDYLVLNSTFNLEDDSANYNASIYNALGSSDAQKNVQCAGYAKSIQYLCDKAGITCMVVTGQNNEGSSHAWNVVDVDGTWYNLDVTWDDPILSTPIYNNVRYKYFLIPDSWVHDIEYFHINEIRLSDGSYVKYFDPPACTATDKNYFKQSGFVYNDFESADKALRAEIKEAAEDGSRAAHIMCGSQEVYDAIFDVRMDYNNYAKEFPGVRGVADECGKEMLLIEFDVLYD